MLNKMLVLVFNMNETNQKCSHVLVVTRFPVQLCDISCATTEASERSPA